MEQQAAPDRAEPPPTGTREARTPPADGETRSRMPAEPPLPEYLKVLERFRAAEPVIVQPRLDAPSRLILETMNVQRIQIEREFLPLDKRGSIAVVIDGQGIEWTPRTQVLELQRSTSGDWKPSQKKAP